MHSRRHGTKPQYDQFVFIRFACGDAYYSYIVKSLEHIYIIIPKKWINRKMHSWVWIKQHFSFQNKYCDSFYQCIKCFASNSSRLKMKWCCCTPRNVTQTFVEHKECVTGNLWSSSVVWVLSGLHQKSIVSDSKLHFVSPGSAPPLCRTHFVLE